MMGRFYLLLLVFCALAVESHCGTITLEIINVGTYRPPFCVTFWDFTYPNLTMGTPPGPNDMGSPFYRYELSASGYKANGVSYGSGSRLWVNFGDGWQSLRYVRAWGDVADGAYPTLYVRFEEGTSNRVEYTSDPRPPLPVQGVPSGWPYGGYGFDSGMEQHQFTADEGSWVIDEDGNPVFVNNYLDPSWTTPPPPSGQHWEFGRRPGGPVMAPNGDIPEWFLASDDQFVGDDYILPFTPTNYPDGDGVLGAGMERIDYWGRVNADGAFRREELLRANKLSVDMTRSDIRSGFDATVSKLQDLDSGVAAVKTAVDQNAQTVKQAIEQAEIQVDLGDGSLTVDFPSEIEVDLGEGSYAGYGDLVDLGDWANADADLYQTGVDTNFRSAAIAPSIASADYNIVSGDGDSWISGLGNGVAGAAETLVAGVSAFLDPFKAIGKVESLTVTIYNNPMVIDFGPFMAVINVIRAIAVLAVYYLAFCSVRSAIFMIFGGA